MYFVTEDNSWSKIAKNTSTRIKDTAVRCTTEHLNKFPFISIHPNYNYKSTALPTSAEGCKPIWEHRHVCFLPSAGDTLLLHSPRGFSCRNHSGSNCVSRYWSQISVREKYTAEYLLLLCQTNATKRETHDMQKQWTWGGQIQSGALR